MKTPPYLSHSPDDTAAFAGQLATQWKEGTIVALYGEPGAGKTCFARGVARSLGITDPITSPTYTLIHEYPSQPPLYHMDLYRIGSSHDLFSLGLDEYFEGDGITLIEWAERAENCLPGHTLRITITIGQKPTLRTITLKEP